MVLSLLFLWAPPGLWMKGGDIIFLRPEYPLKASPDSAGNQGSSCDSPPDWGALITPVCLGPLLEGRASRPS